MFIYNNIKEINLLKLEEKQFYIYVIKNEPQGNIKIGISSNIKQRMKSLSGSNNGGNKIVKIAVSEPTYLYTLEQIIHNHFSKYRIQNTEWFYDLEFSDVTNYIDKLFESDEYKKLNKIREGFAKNQ